MLVDVTEGGFGVDQGLHGGSMAKVSGRKQRHP
jgi:hypothetical protein